MRVPPVPWIGHAPVISRSAASIAVRIDDQRVSSSLPDFCSLEAYTTSIGRLWPNSPANDWKVSVKPSMK